MFKLSIIKLVRLSSFSLLLVVLVACGSSDPEVKPVKAEFAGVADIRRTNTNAEADLRVSALDAEDQVLRTGTITRPTVNINSLVINSTALSTQAYVPTSANAKVCGNIQAGNQNNTVTAVLTFDASGSMATTDRSQLRTNAGEQFVQRMRSQDTTAVGWFNSSRSSSPFTYFHLEQDFTNDKSILNTAVSRSTKASGGTRLWESVDDTLNLLNKTTGSNKIAVILSDGKDSASTSTLNNIISKANTNSIRIYTIGLSTGSDPNLSKIASETNGTFIPVDDSNDLVGSFTGIFSGAQASGCISVIFSPPPPVGTSIQGGLQFEVNDAPLQSQFAIRF